MKHGYVVPVGELLPGDVSQQVEEDVCYQDNQEAMLIVLQITLYLYYCCSWGKCLIHSVNLSAIVLWLCLFVAFDLAIWFRAQQIIN